MMRTRSPIAGAALMLLVLAAGCSSEHNDTSRASSPPQEFSDDDKRAARVLSISNNQALLDAPNSYVRALLCRSAIESVAERLEQARTLMMPGQRDAMQQARAYFQEQLWILAQREGKSEEDLSSELTEVAERHSDSGENAQIAVACLRQLQVRG